jgi:hypothetical protein
MPETTQTGLNAPHANTRAVSMQMGTVLATDGSAERFVVSGSGTTVIEGFRPGEDLLVLPTGTSRTSVQVEPDWHGDAWGLRISYGNGDDSVFLRWGWRFEIDEDLAIAGSTSDGVDDSDGGSPSPGGDVEIGAGPDTLVLEVSGEAYQGSPEFVVRVNGQQIGGTFTATATHGSDSNTLTLRGDFGDRADVTVAFVNDLWGGTASTDRNLHIEAATFNGVAIADAPQIIWGNYEVAFTGTSGPPDDGSNDDSDISFGSGPDTLVLDVSSESYQGDAQLTVHVNGQQVGGTFTATMAHGAGSNTLTLRGDWGADPEIRVAFVNDLWEGTAATDRNLHIDGASYNGEAIAGAAQTIWGDYSVTLAAGSDGPGDGGEGPGDGVGENPGNGGGTPDNPDGEVNILVRGQSNAQAFTMYGGAGELERVLEERLGVDVHILASYETANGHNTINSATRFMDWDSDGQQQGLINFLNDQSAAIRDNPTLTVWMHNEYDQQSMDLTTNEWLSEVRADAELVRDALGQDASTTPYEFVPIKYPYGGNFEAIGNGMEALSAEAGFNADISWAAQSASMDGDGWAGSSHLGWNDAQQLGRDLAEELAGVLAPLTGNGAGENPGDGGGEGPGDGGGEGPGDGGGETPSGYTLVFSDDFSEGYKTENWGMPFNGGVYWNGAWSWSGDEVGVENGVLQVSATRHSDGWWTGGGLNTMKAGHTIQYGIIELDARVQRSKA